jgi:membrane protein
MTRGVPAWHVARVTHLAVAPAMMKAFDIPIGWGDLFKRTFREFNQDNGLGLAAQLSFYLLLALVPAIVFLVALASFLPGATIDQLIATARPFMPADMFALLQGLLQNVREDQSGGLLTFGLLMALWSSSAAIVGVIYAMNQVYDIEEGRPWWKVRLTAIGLTIALAMFVLVALGLVMVGPWLADWMADHFGFGAVFAWTWKILQWPLVFALVAIGVAMLNYFAPDAEQDWTWITPGALLATALWLLASLAFRVYVTSFADFNATYGSLGGVIVLMLWFYISSMAILMGAEMNAEIEHASPHGKDAGEKVPGQRKKIGAAAARYYEQRQRERGLAETFAPGPAPRRGPAPRALLPAHAGSGGGSRWLGLPLFLIMWFRRRNRT